MYYEIEERFHLEKIVFDDEKLTVGKKVYPYEDIVKLELTSTPIFSTYGIMSITVEGREIPVPFPRMAAEKLKRAIREFERLQEMPVKKEADPMQTEKTPPDIYEEVKKLKELLDLEIITEEEFQKKKKELLGL